MLSRRALLAGAASSFATGVVAEAPLTSPRPQARRNAEPQTIAELIADAGLSGIVGFAMADVETGTPISLIRSDIPLPPASVAKATTALYALENLGEDHRFNTRLLADGQIKDGILDGNLILVGGGDPNLVTDHLADLAQSLKDTGLKEVKGDFLFWDEALVNLDELDETQLDWAGYNPTITGLNLNFNRVHFEWKRTGSSYDIAMDARSANYRPRVNIARMQVVDRTGPLFTYSDGGGFDQWTVARSALNNTGSRWLPVRYPAHYAAEVFATLARSHGIVLKTAREVDRLPDVAPLVTYRSVPLRRMVRDMLLYSTNITAEAVGLSATAVLDNQRRGLRYSATCMSRWAKERVGMDANFVDHSGLGDASRLTAGGMLDLLMAQNVMPQLRPLMKEIAITDERRRAIPNFPGEVRAKTGTLNYVSSLAGYIRTVKGRDLAFAFFAADLDARDIGKAQGAEQPRGSQTWNNRAKRLQQVILQQMILNG